MFRSRQNRRGDAVGAVLSEGDDPALRVFDGLEAVRSLVAEGGLAFEETGTDGDLFQLAGFKIARRPDSVSGASKLIGRASSSSRPKQSAGTSRQAQAEKYPEWKPGNEFKAKRDAALNPSAQKP